MLELVGNLGVMATTVGAFTFGIMAVINMFRTVYYRKQGVPLTRGFGSPFNILFFPSQLTEHGLAARRKVLYAVLGCLSCCIAGMVIGVGTGVLK